MARPSAHNMRMNGTFDTLGYTRRLEAAGVPSEQAEAHALALGEALKTQLATKSDIHELRQLINHVASDSEKRDMLLDAKINLEVQRLEGLIKEQGDRLHNALLKQKTDLMGWTLALNISQLAILFAALAYLRA